MGIATRALWETVPLGLQGLPYPTVQADGTLVLSAAHVPKILSKLSAEEVNGIAIRDMPAPEHFPYFLSVLDAINAKSRRAFMMESEPGVGKSFFADFIARLMTGSSALSYECAGKRLSDLLFTTALTERPEQTLYDRVLDKVRQGKAHPLSLARLKKSLGAAFDPTTAMVDWEQAVADVTAVDATFQAIAQAEGINMQSSIALREDMGVIPRGYEEDRVVLADEYTDGKPDSSKALNGTLEWLMRRGAPEITVTSGSGLEYTLGDLSAKPGFLVFLTANPAGDARGTGELPASQHDRLNPVPLPPLGKLGLAHRFCWTMTGLPLSTLHQLYGQHFETEEEFSVFCKRLRTPGLSAQAIERIPAHQWLFLERPLAVIAVANQYAELFSKWRTKFNLNNHNLSPELMGELTDDWVQKNRPGPRLFDDWWKAALERSGRSAAKDHVVKPGTKFTALTSADLVAPLSMDRLGHDLMDVTAEDIRKRTQEQPVTRSIIVTDAAELGILPSRQNGAKIKTVAQLLSGADDAPAETAVNPASPQSTTGASASAAENLVVGRFFANKGIFAGMWEPKDREGRSIGKRFKVFAREKDLTDASGSRKVFTFKEAVQEVCKLPDGGNFWNDTELYNALKQGMGLGQWFIPPRELLHGLDVDGSKVRDQHLYGLRDEGDFRGTYTTDRGNSKDFPHYYWSCTEVRDFSPDVWASSFSGGGVDCFYIAHDRLRCRPCRVELAL